MDQAQKTSSDPLRNRGTAFTEAERRNLGPGGKLPSAVETLEQPSLLPPVVGRSLVVVTASSPVTGYDRAPAVALQVDDEGTTLREAALACRDASTAEPDRVVDPRAVVGNP